MPRPRIATLVSSAVALAAAFSFLGPFAAHAQIPFGTTTTTTTAPPPVPTTSATPLRPTESTTTTTTEPPSDPDPGPAPESASDDRPAPADDSSAPPATVAGDSGAPAGAPGASASGASGPAPAKAARPKAGTLAAGAAPEDVQRLVDSIRRTPANNTRKLLEALSTLRARGMSDAEVVDAGFGRFPVGGPTTFTDDWHFPRFVPTFHLHMGTDLFAACGTPARAPAAGTLKLAQGGSGGLAAYVYAPDGSYYYLAHLQRFVPTQQSGQRVELGETIGYVGDSGNAVGSPCHVHFEIHPAPSTRVVTGTGKAKKVTLVPRPVPVGTKLEAVNPKPHLDAWLDEALLRVPDLASALEGRPSAVAAADRTRRPGDGEAGGSLTGRVAPRSQLLWATAVSPAGGAWRLAQAEARSMAGEVDWTRRAKKQQTRIEEEQWARHVTLALLTPLTPPAMLDTHDVGAD